MLFNMVTSGYLRFCVLCLQVVFSQWCCSLRASLQTRLHSHLLVQRYHIWSVYKCQPVLLPSSTLTFTVGYPISCSQSAHIGPASRYCRLCCCWAEERGFSCTGRQTVLDFYKMLYYVFEEMPCVTLLLFFRDLSFKQHFSLVFFCHWYCMWI